MQQDHQIDSALKRIDEAVASIQQLATGNSLAEALLGKRSGAPEALLRLVIDRIPAMVWAKRVPDGFMLLCNDLAAEMGGTTRKLMEGTFPERWWPADFTKKWLMDDNEVASSGRPKENFYEKIIHPKSGQIRWVRTSKFPLMDAFGKVVAVLVFAYDVTDIVPADVKNGRA